MIPSGLTSSVINRARLGDGYVRVRDSGLVTAVAQFLYDEAALLDEWRLDEWLALFHPEAAQYLIPSPEDLSDDPATTLHLVNYSMTTLAGRIGRLLGLTGNIVLSRLLGILLAALAVQFVTSATLILFLC